MELPNSDFSPAFFKKGIRCLVPKKTPVKLMDINFWYSEIVTSVISLPNHTPALLIKISTVLLFFSRELEKLIHSSSLATFISTKLASLPWQETSFIVFKPSFLFVSKIKILAPA